MMDKERIWLVPENEEEQEKYKLIVEKLTDKHWVPLDNKDMKELLKMDYILFGKDNDGEAGISGAVKILGKILKDNDFHTEVIVKNEYFKPFFRYLKKGMKLNIYTPINFYFQRERPVLVVIGDEKLGVIAPYIGELN